MRRSRALQTIYDQLNVTPLLDLAWTLLVVFIIMATATVQGIVVELPRASIQPSLSEPRTRAVTVTADGQIYLDTTPVSLPELALRLSQLRAADPGLPIVVKGDGQVRYKEVVAVLEALQRAGIANVGLVTQRLVK